MTLGLLVNQTGFTGTRLFGIGPVDVLLPTKTKAVFLYDLQTDTSFGGVEVDIAKYKKLTGTVGLAATVERGDIEGSPYVGLDYDFGSVMGIDWLRIGGFYYRDFKLGNNHGGFKTSAELKFK